MKKLTAYQDDRLGRLRAICRDWPDVTQYGFRIEASVYRFRGTLPLVWQELEEMGLVTITQDGDGILVSPVGGAA